MNLAVRIARLQERCLWAALITRVALFVLFCALPGIVLGPVAQGQTYRQGLPGGLAQPFCVHEDEGAPLFPRSVRKGWVARLSAPKVHASLIGC